MTLDDGGDAIGNQIEQPRRAAGDLGQPITVELVAIHREVDQSARTGAFSEFARNRSGFEIIDFGMERGARSGTGAATVRRNQQERRGAVD